MIRRAAAVVIALTLNPALLYAQDAVITVSAPSADVYKGPSTITPVIGHVSRGTVLTVSRNLGSWVRIPWPEAQDGIGYIHVSMGRIGAPSGDAGLNVSAATSPARTPQTTSIPPLTRTSVGERVVPSGQLNTTPASHIVGLGGLFGPTHAFGATARAWQNNHLGVQFGFTRDAMTSDLAAGRVTTLQFEPGVVYGLFDHVSDYVWIRPYVGSVVSFRRQTWSIGAPLVAEPVSDSNVGFRVFGGSELTFASLPRFGLSADLGYRRFTTPFAGFEMDRISASIAGHWYVK